jgi:hypothetical protein
MRIDLKEAIKRLSLNDIKNVWSSKKFEPTIEISESDYEEFKHWLLNGQNSSLHIQSDLTAY